MPDFVPFRALHYSTDVTGTDLSAVAAPPYDVIDDERRAHLRDQHPHNAVHLTLPHDDRPGDRYERAARVFDEWIREGILAPDDEPAFYVYRVGFSDEDGGPRQMTGVIGALELIEPGSGGVLPHERTMPKPASDRLDLLRATRANLEPIWALSLADGLSRLLVPDEPPIAHCTDSRGAHHRIYRMTSPTRTATVREIVGAAPVVIADGHHRYETSLRYRDERRHAGDGAGGHDFIMTLVVELADEQLAVQPIHRVVEGLPDPAGFRRDLSAAFELTSLGPNEPEVVDDLPRSMDRASVPALVDADGIALLTPRPGALDEALSREPEPLRSVDAARFEAGIAPLLERLGATVSHRHDRARVADLVRKGTADAAVILRPVDVPTIRRVAASGERMPPKTTFFHPKPSTGLVFRRLDD